MPFKTRRRKISSAQRRYSFYESQTANWTGLEEKTVESARTDQVKLSRIESSYGYVKQDLGKTILLAGLIIISQIALRLFSGRGFLPNW